VGVFGAAGGEVGRKTAGDFDGVGERGFVAKKQVFHQRLAGAFDAAVGAVGARIEGAAQGFVHDPLVAQGHFGLIIGPRDEVVHLGLMLEHHEGDDVAVG